MRFARRLRGGPSTDGAAPEPGDQTGVRPPAGAPVASYAAVLDGRHLWVAVDERPGTLALRDATGRVVAEAEPGPSAVLPLPDPPTALEVVLLPPGGRAAQPVWTPEPASAVVPAAAGGWRWEVRRGPDGTLGLAADRLPAAVTLRAVSAAPGTITLRCDPPDGLSLRDATGRVRALDPGPEGLVTLDAADLDDLVPGAVALTAGLDHRPVRRHHDALADPGRGAPLPELVDLRSGRVVLSMRWDHDGVLVLETPEAVAT